MNWDGEVLLRRASHHTSRRVPTGVEHLHPSVKANLWAQVQLNIWSTFLHLCRVIHSLTPQTPTFHFPILQLHLLNSEDLLSAEAGIFPDMFKVLQSVCATCVLRWDMHLASMMSHWNKVINWWSDKKYFMFLHSELSWINIICVYLLWYCDDFCLILGVYDVRISYRHRTVQFSSFVFRRSSLKTKCFFFWLME